MSEHNHGTVKSYITGFVLSIALTLLPFYAVAKQLFDRHTLMMALTATAILQLLVQSVYFLHLNRSSAARWNLLAFLFMLVVVFIIVAGSLWIMYHMDTNMMMR